jgi:hypothetical protein
MPRPPSSRLARSIATLVTLFVLTLVAHLEAHEATPGVIALKEVAPGRYLMQWTPPSPPVDDLEVRFPAPCSCDGKAVLATQAVVPGVPSLLDCGGQRLSGSVTFQTRAASLGRIAVNVEWLNGPPTLLLSSGTPPSVTLQNARGGARSSSFDVLGQYLALGVEHIIVCGHYNCGGVKAAMNDERLGLINNWLRHIQYVMRTHGKTLDALEDETERFYKLCDLNVLEQALNVCETYFVKDAWESGKNLKIHGWIYDMREGFLRKLGIELENKEQFQSLRENNLHFTAEKQ